MWDYNCVTRRPWAYLTDEAEKDYVLETMAICGPTTVSRDVLGHTLQMKLRKTMCLKPWLPVGLQLCHETSIGIPCR
ncbi:hypothetical protein Bpfe_006760 [Biomphalaria pfeifferi]|uniref:Uncharacterized protein n=1 Tax=Biomphalaria pfeifferi TaxID=112525 RepID=A0AAD8C0N8_BIOPF|nr:hypothetical protein Bpfe_006760 [Biomphalaria pfeifferi]